MQPHPESLKKKFQRRRRVAFTAVVVVLLLLSAGAGVLAQRIIGWSEEDWARHNSIIEPGVSNTPEMAVAVDDERLPTKHREPEIRSVRHPNPIEDPPEAGSSKSISIKSADLDRRYILSLPPDVKRVDEAGDGEDNPLPLVLAYHGYQESPESIARYSGMGRAGAIVVYPEGVDKSWSGADYAKTTGEQDLAFTRNIIDQVSSTYQVDSYGVFASGMSNGGGFAYKIACEMPEMFSAVASVAGAYYTGTWEGCAGAEGNKRFPPGPAVPFLEIHGRKDTRIQYDGGERDGNSYLSAVQASSLYAQRAGCQNSPIVTGAAPKVQRMQWGNCEGDKEVVHLAIGDAGHTWPGQIEQLSGSAALDDKDSGNESSDAITATTEILAFFTRHGMQSPATAAKKDS